MNQIGYYAGRSKNPKIRQRTPVKPSKLKDKPGYNTKIEPMVNPTIQKNV